MLLQRKDTKGKQPETPFLRKRGLATLPKREGHLRTRRRKCFVPTEYIITTRLPNGGSFLDFGFTANRSHRFLLCAAVKRIAPTNGLFTEVILLEAVPTGSPLSANPFVDGMRLPTLESKCLCSKIAEQVKPQKPPRPGRWRPSGRR